jgi:hypothetical protein
VIVQEAFTAKAFGLTGQLLVWVTLFRTIPLIVALVKVSGDVP